MTNISAAQHDLLSKLASTIDGVIEAPEGNQATIKSLIKRGWLISIPVQDGPSRLHITDAGRQAVASSDQSPPGANEGDEAIVEPERQAKPGPVQPKGKIATLVDLLRQEEGATVDAMMAATGWQAHSVRGAMSGSIKKALGLEVTSEKTEAGRIYRIVDGATA